VADEIVPVQFAQLELPAPQKIKPRFGRINNVFVDITVELGRKEMSVRDLTNLKEQEVIDLDKLAGEAFDILINGRPFAEGEIVVVTDLMAVRITRLIDRTPPEEEEEA
jgi:flagellar motor switch protein FliN/FliY